MITLVPGVQVWDLGRGFCINTLPCHSPMTALCMSAWLLCV